MSLRTLNRYMSRQFLKMWALCLGAFYMIFLMVDFIERSRHLFKHGANFGAIFLYFLFKSPMILYMMVPVAVLLGSLLTLAVMSKNSEIVAMKAGGISVIRAIAPILAWTAAISLASFVVNEYVVPAANQKASFIYKTGIKKQKWKVKYKRRNVWYKASNAIYRFDLFVPEQEKISGVAVYRFDDEFNLVERTEAERAQFYDDSWHFLQGRRYTFENGALVQAEPFLDRVMPLPETPDELKVYQRKAEEMSFRELRAYVKKLDKEGYDPTRYVVDMYGKLSFPLVSLIMAILGIPFAIRHGRSGGVAAGIGIAVVIGVAYWILLAWMLALGHSGALGPITAAWGSHLIFGAAGIFRLIRTEQ